MVSVIDASRHAALSDSTGRPGPALSHALWYDGPTSAQRSDSALVCHTSGHQPVDGVSPLPPKMASRYSGEVGDLGQRHAEHSRRVEDGGIGDCQAVPGRIDEGSGQ